MGSLGWGRGFPEKQAVGGGPYFPALAHWAKLSVKQTWQLVFQTLVCFSLLWWVFIPLKDGLGTWPG